MKKTKSLMFSLMLLLTLSAFGQTNGKLIGTKSHVKFYSHTAAEDIEANNYTSVSTINVETGAVVFSVPMQGFEFEKSLMQKHFNKEKFLDTKAHPKSKLVGTITNLGDIDFSGDGEYPANIEGELTIKGKPNPIKEKGTITIKGNSIVVQSKFLVTLADYGITFGKGKLATNIAKDVEITVHSEYLPE